MENSKQPPFSTLENEYLENILRQLVKNHDIIQVFFTKHSASNQEYLVFHVQQKETADLLQKQKWVTKIRERDNINALFVYATKLQYQFTAGHPFIQFYCRPSSIMYQNTEAGNLLPVRSNWKKYKNKYHAFKERFYNDHEMQQHQIQMLISEDAYNSVFTTYERLIEYDLKYLEELYTGITFTSLNLTERIDNLITYIPEIQKYFVQKNRKGYYLTELFTKVREATCGGEAIYESEMFEAVGITEKNLFLLVETRFAELKKRIKKGFSEKHKMVPLLSETPAETTIDTAIKTITKAVETEQIYAFHQTTYGQKNTHYLLIIANAVSNEKLQATNQSLKSTTDENRDFVLISHSRYWIQKNLYQHQQFFAQIIQSKYLVYASNPYLPELHWETAHNPYHADLYFCYRPAKNTALQFFKIANDPTENYQGLEYLFALFFVSFCRTYIFVKTYYLPNHLSSAALWQMCVYADASICKYNYLIEQFPSDVFRFIDKHTSLHHSISRLSKEDATRMNTMVEKLMEELHNLVIEGKLLATFEQDETDKTA